MLLIYEKNIVDMDGLIDLIYTLKSGDRQKAKIYATPKMAAKLALINDELPEQYAFEPVEQGGAMEFKPTGHGLVVKHELPNGAQLAFGDIDSDLIERLA